MAVLHGVLLRLVGRAELSVHLPPLPYALALAPPAESSPGTKKFFCKSVVHTKAAPLMGRNHFWTGFWERGHEQFSESKSPPYRGVQVKVPIKGLRRMDVRRAPCTMTGTSTG